jgi:hypothetical protein
VASVTYHVAVPFDRNDDGELAPGEAQECQTSLAAIRRAQSMAAVHAGAIAFSRAGDPGTGEFESAEVLRAFGEVPTEDALKGYE